MKNLYFAAVVVASVIYGAARAQDLPPIPRGSLGSGANLGQALGDLGTPGVPGNSPFSRGLGQIVSGWTQQGIHGPELAERIHWLQQMRADERAERTRWLEQRRFRDGDRDDHFRDLREDRRELRDDLRRVREDERRLSRDREDLRRDLRDRDDRSRDRDLREDRRELRDDERRLRDDQRRVARDREDLRRDLRDRDRNRDDHFRDRDDRSGDRNRDDRFRDRDRDNRFRDRDDHTLRDHDPRRDRDDRRRDRDDFARKDREIRGSRDYGHDHNVVRKDDFGKQLGAQGVKRDHQPAVHDIKKDDAKKHTPNVRTDHHFSVPSPRSSSPFGKGRGKG